MISNVIFGIFETDGYVSREQAGGIRVGFSTTSEQLAHQLHWLLLRWGVGSSMQRRDPRSQRVGLVKGRRISGKFPSWEVRVSGVDNVSAFAAAIPMWGPRGQVVTRELAELGGRYRGSQRIYLSDELVEPILAHLERIGATAQLAAQLVGEDAGNPRGGMKVVLGASRLRRDRVQRLADGLDDPFLQDILADQLWFSRVAEILPARRCRTFDVEVADLHNLVAEDVVVHNCAPPFKTAECDIIFGTGISREGGLIDLGVEQSIVRKSGAWYTYEGDQLGQGKENSRNFLRDNPDLANEIEKKIKEKLGVGPRIDAEAAPATGPAHGRRPVPPRPVLRRLVPPWAGRRLAAQARAGLRARRLAWAAVPDRPATKRRAASRSSARAGNAAAGTAAVGTARAGLANAGEPARWWLGPGKQALGRNRSGTLRSRPGSSASGCSPGGRVPGPSSRRRCSAAASRTPRLPRSSPASPR